MAEAARNRAPQGLFDVLAHEQARFEHDDPLGGNRHFLPGFRVAASTGRALPHLEDPEIAQFDRLALFQVCDEMVEGSLDHPLDIHLGDPSFLGNDEH